MSGNYTVSIAGAEGASSIAKDGTALCTANGASGKNGGTGGGGGGKGDGIAKYPFGDSTAYKCHCAGGGGGVSVNHTDMGSPTRSYVGSGGSNGSVGRSGDGTAGGTYGGGNGGSASAGASQSPFASNGSAAFFYGSGGGGGGYAYDLWNGTATGAGGAGYQGIVYLLIR